jgi:hypothetical protein
MNKEQNLRQRLKSNKRSKARSLVFSVLTVVLLIGLTLAVTAQSTPSSQLTITISSQGMTPSSATVSSGITHLLVKNNSSVETLHLKVTREGGEVVKEMTAPNSSNEWAIELELSAGLYTISEVSNTSWNCHVTVQAPPPIVVNGPGAAEHP